MHRLWIARRSLRALAGLPHALRLQGPDSSVNIGAMAAYIGFCGCQVALPTIGVTPEGEELADGARLISSLSQAAWSMPVLCLLKTEGGLLEADAVQFTPARAAKAGSDAVLVSFDRALTATEIAAWTGQCPQRPKIIKNTHFGWRTLAEAFGGTDWIAFVRHLEASRSGPAQIIALNGRYAPWVPEDLRM